jgi:fumarate hydratase class II
LEFRQAISPFKGQASLDILVELSGACKTAAVAIAKIAGDLRWMNSGPLTGLAEIQLPALQPGSSIMPAKVNPVIPEAVLMAVAQVIGNDSVLTFCAMGSSFQLNTMLPLAGAKLIESLELLRNSAYSLREKAISGLVINTDRFAHSLRYNPILVTSLNPVIGYAKAAEIGKIAQQEGRPILEIALEQTELSKEDLEQLLDPRKLAAGNRNLTS